MCWEEEVCERPSFTALKEKLASLQSQDSVPILSLNIDSSLPYYNLSLSSTSAKNGGGKKEGDESLGNYWQRRDKVGM